jgi:hypothetical protein
MAFIRKIYKRVIIPQITYACSIWSNASTPTKPYTQKTLNMLQSIQAKAEKTITGAFRATAKPALDIEAYLLPIKQRIWKYNAATEIGIATGQKIPELENHGQRGERKKYIAPLEKIHQKAEKEQLRDLTSKETILTHITPPWWKGPKIRIDTPKAAEKNHEKDLINGNNAIRVYTNGSGIDGYIRAAAVCLATNQTKSSYIGKNTTSTVYASELQNIILALEIT